MTTPTKSHTPTEVRRKTLRRLAREEKSRAKKMKSLRKKLSLLGKANAVSLERRVALAAQNLVGMSVVTRGRFDDLPWDRSGIMLTADETHCTVDFGTPYGVRQMLLTDIMGADAEMRRRMLVGEA